MAPVAQADDAQHVFDALGPEALGDVIEHGVKDQVFLSRQPVVERRVLKDHADGLPDLIRLREDIETGQDRAAASRRQKRGENVDRGGLARAVGAEKAEEFTLFHLEINPCDGSEIAELLHQLVDFDDCIHGYSAPLSRSGEFYGRETYTGGKSKNLPRRVFLGTVGPQPLDNLDTVAISVVN